MGGATKKRLCFAIECNSGMPLNRAIQEDTGDGTVHIIVPDLQATLSRKVWKNFILWYCTNISQKRKYLCLHYSIPLIISNLLSHLSNNLFLFFFLSPISSSFVAISNTHRHQPLSLLFTPLPTPSPTTSCSFLSATSTVDPPPRSSPPLLLVPSLPSLLPPLALCLLRYSHSKLSDRDLSLVSGDHRLRSIMLYMSHDVIINSSILFVDGNNSKKRVKLVDEPPPVYELKFNEPPSAPVYTTRKLSGASKNGLQIKLVEVGSLKICKESLFSSLQVEIFLVDGDFEFDKLKSTWTIDKLYGKRLRARKGKRPLLLGACIKSLHDGRATFNDLSITDNSSWVSSGKFKLAARIKPDSCNGLRIKGALSEPFVVRECRGEG